MVLFLVRIQFLNLKKEILENSMVTILFFQLNLNTHDNCHRFHRL